jgi:DNA-binding response OmpR family regulator
MSFRILLVDPDWAAAAASERAMVQAGYRVASVVTFEEASRQISLDYLDLLVTKVRLGAFNGLHLLLRCRAERPDVPVIIVGALADHTDDMTRLGAPFVTTPIEKASFLDLVATLLSGRAPRDPTGARRWPRRPAVLPATVSDGFVRVVELSYGGLRLEMADALDETRVPVDIWLPSLGLSVKAVPRWSRPADPVECWWCGVEVALPGYDTTRTWRWIVDSLN